MRLFLLLLFCAPSSFAAVLVSESVGQVGTRILTSREVQISSTIEHILEPEKNEKGLFQIKPEEPGFPNQVTALLLEAVVAREAESFNVGQVSDQDVKAAAEKVAKTVKGNSYWEALEVTPDEVRQQVQQKLQAKSFIKFKTESMSSIVSERDVRDYYEKNRAKFGNVPYASIHDNIKAYLGQEQLKDRLRSWFEVIKRKYQVRNFLLEGSGP